MDLSWDTNEDASSVKRAAASTQVLLFASNRVHTCCGVRSSCSETMGAVVHAGTARDARSENLA